MTVALWRKSTNELFKGGVSLENNPTNRIVVAAALITNDRQVLLQRCPAGHAYEGLWEFPGGKLEQGEAPETGLIRELREELAVDVQAGDLVPLGFSSDPDQRIGKRSPYVILLYTCRKWRGEPQAMEGQAICWFDGDALANLAMPPLDIPLAKKLLQTR